MNDDRHDSDDGYQSRGHKRRRVRAVHDQRHKWLEQLVKRPEDTLPHWQGDPDFEGLLHQLRHTKASGGRQRLIRYIVRRSHEDIWTEVQAYVERKVNAHLEAVNAEKAHVRLRDELVEHEAAFEKFRPHLPRERQQQMRLLILAARRSPSNPQGKGARKKLLRLVRDLVQDGLLRDSDHD
ncbi:MAG: DUF615 domain-containing protein [Myxococcota bacterium]|nr:DUF615 domain-containing protein [Myxococcota bacterium]